MFSFTKKSFLFSGISVGCQKRPVNKEGYEKRKERLKMEQSEGQKTHEKRLRETEDPQPLLSLSLL